MQCLGALLSCFPTERKHRTVKARALHVFRHFERTVLRDLVQEQLEKLGDESQYLAISLVNPQVVKVENGNLSRSTIAHLPSGSAHAGDLMLCDDHKVHLVVGFWAVDGNVAVQTKPLLQLADGSWAESGVGVSFVDAECCKCPLTFAEKQTGVYRVVLPLLC